MPLPEGRPGRGLFRAQVRPGQNFGHYTYDMLRQMGNGRHELTFPDAAAAAPSADTTGPDSSGAGH